MAHPNLDTIDRFFEAYGRHDLVAIRLVMAEEVTWSFPGSHPASGTQAGIDAVIAFFDTMGGIMGESNVEAVKRVTDANDGYVVECQHIRTHRKDAEIWITFGVCSGASPMERSWKGGTVPVTHKRLTNSSADD
jgi:hypothetical protein